MRFSSHFFFFLLKEKKRGKKMWSPNQMAPGNARKKKIEAEAGFLSWRLKRERGYEPHSLDLSSTVSSRRQRPRGGLRRPWQEGWYDFFVKKRQKKSTHLFSFCRRFSSQKKDLLDVQRKTMMTKTTTKKKMKAKPVVWSFPSRRRGKNVRTEFDTAQENLCFKKNNSSAATLASLARSEARRARSRTHNRDGR